MGFVKSNNEFIRLVNQGGVQINREKIDEKSTFLYEVRVLICRIELTGKVTIIYIR